MKKHQTSPPPPKEERTVNLQHTHIVPLPFLQLTILRSTPSLPKPFLRSQSKKELLGICV